MKTLSQIINYALPALYFFVVIVYYQIFKFQKRDLEKYTVPLLLVLLFFDGFSIVSRIIALNLMPLSTIFDAFSLLSFCVIFVYLIIETTIKNKSTGLFLVSFAFVFKTIAAFHFKWNAKSSAILSDPTFAVHASLTICGYTALTISAIYAVLYMVQEHNMKKKKFDVVSLQLPPLAYLESMSIRSVTIGILVIGIGLGLGHIQAYKMFGKLWLPDPKIIISDLIFIFYFSGYIINKFLKLNSKWMARFSLLGYIILLASAISVVTISNSFHNFY